MRIFKSFLGFICKKNLERSNKRKFQIYQSTKKSKIKLRVQKTNS
jgi:hypothetical protein